MSFSKPIIATRAEGLRRLEAFLPHASGTYRDYRNHLSHPDGLPTVSKLSPWLRHRLITEQEVIDAVVDEHGVRAAEKFIQEVLWRSYWKGFLEQRPSLWTDYRHKESAIPSKHTGIECLNDWQQELEATGYLHNHVRMWFASIWQFTLGRSWQSGADLFLRHLIDGDPASNTLSWRWVGGRQTNGKIYLATPGNIAKHTNGQYKPAQLATNVEPPAPPELPARIPLPSTPDWQVTPKTALLIHEEDLHPESIFGHPQWASVVALQSTSWRSAILVSDVVNQFVAEALKDAASRNTSSNSNDAACYLASESGFNALLAHLHNAKITQLLTPWAPCGPTADALTALEPLLKEKGVQLIRVPREWDLQLWPHATHGFFRFFKAVRAQHPLFGPTPQNE